MGRRGTLTRELVVAAARERLSHAGADQLSLRGVARDLGVTAPALYAYVQDKEELLAAVATDHFERLVDRFDAMQGTDPLERIRAMSHAYVAHALESPALFRLLFRYPPTPVPGFEVFPPAARAFGAAAAVTEAAIADGLLRAEDAATASMVMWAAVHGVAEVLLLGLGLDERAGQGLLDAVIDTVLAGQGAPAERT